MIVNKKSNFPNWDGFDWISILAMPIVVYILGAIFMINGVGNYAHYNPDPIPLSLLYVIFGCSLLVASGLLIVISVNKRQIEDLKRKIESLEQKNKDK